MNVKRRSAALLAGAVVVAELLVGAAVVAAIPANAATGSHQYTVKATLNGRSGPSLSAVTARENMYPNGSTVTVSCQRTGGAAYGSSIWDRTAKGAWIPDAYVKTGHSGFDPRLPRCGTSLAGTAFVTTDALNGRKTKKVSAAAVKVYGKNTLIKVQCQAYGQYAYGDAVWDKTSDGLFVPDYYVRTGYSGFVPNMPRCDSDQPSGASSSGGGTSGGTSGGSSGGTGTATGAPSSHNCAVIGHGRSAGNPAKTKGSTAGTRAQKIDRIVTAATAETKKGWSYSWGAGGKGGAACGSGAVSPSGYQDYNRAGFDCSGLTEYAFWAGAGIDIGMSTSSQNVYKGNGFTYKGRLSVGSMQRGDLIFWGTHGGSTSHVAIYIGGGKMIEAAPPRGSSSVHVTSVYSSYDFVVRPFA
ncbi:hypothetical protein GCM10022286_20220 [Gryllotalpicola daejeonensis]|uniref:NlpC/P60 domain-containing protein n=1 Tax=Gryllotalpicola daejeonensis TaxID=993087 RepID=A0ABP7ZKR3_9MICO